MSYEQDVTLWLRAQVNVEPPPAEVRTLELWLRALAVWRSRTIAAGLIRTYGAVVLSGPFAGMNYAARATEGALLPRLLGTYECELHPVIERLAAGGFECVIDVGCAEGYYAVGLARLMPGALVHAHDTDAAARRACAAMAQANGVEDRVLVGGAFAAGDFAAFAGRRCLVMVDIEGAETDLLLPQAAPALADMTLIVETHDVYQRNAMALMIERFSSTHDIEIVRTGPKTAPLPPEIMGLSHLDQLIAVWEWRKRMTPWLIMTPRLSA